MLEAGLLSFFVFYFVPVKILQAPQVLPGRHKPAMKCLFLLLVGFAPCIALVPCYHGCEPSKSPECLENLKTCKEGEVCMVSSNQGEKKMRCILAKECENDVAASDHCPDPSNPGDHDVCITCCTDQACLANFLGDRTGISTNLGHKNHTHCPVCEKVDHVSHCTDTVLCKNDGYVCMAVVDEWKVSIRCTHAKRCDQVANNDRCSGQGYYQPQDVCTYCCCNEQCMSETLTRIEQGLETIPRAVHCPTCKDSRDPEMCVENAQPCNSGDDTCHIIIKGQLYTAHCQRDTNCDHQKKSNHNPIDCEADYIEDNVTCVYCCQTMECLDEALRPRKGTLSTTTTTTTTTTTAKQANTRSSRTNKPEGTTPSPKTKAPHPPRTTAKSTTVVKPETKPPTSTAKPPNPDDTKTKAPAFTAMPFTEAESKTTPPASTAKPSAPAKQRTKAPPSTAKQSLPAEPTTKPLVSTANPTPAANPRTKASASTAKKCTAAVPKNPTLAPAPAPAPAPSAAPASKSPLQAAAKPTTKPPVSKSSRHLKRTTTKSSTTQKPTAPRTTQRPCHDNELFPCKQTAAFACLDEDLKNYCPFTCGNCPGIHGKKEETPPPVEPPLCYQCGDSESKKACTASELLLGTPQLCSTDTPFCMTDFFRYSENDNRVLKRCVNEDMCKDLWFQQTLNQTECMNGDPTSGPVGMMCHFCCTGNACNAAIRPSSWTLYIPHV